MPKQPNVLVVLSDQQRPDSCGVFGQRLDVTPNLDALAADGVAFDNSFTVQPLCGPSRAALQTGLMPTTTGCWRNGRSLPQDATTLATALGSAGYWTGYVGKWHLASDGGYLPKPGTGATRFGTRPVPPERRGGYEDLWLAADSLEATSLPYRGHVFDGDGNKVPLNGFRVDALTDLAVDALHGRADEERPFFMFVSFLEPHHQNNRFRTIGPKGWAKRFADYDVPADLKGTLGDWRWNYAEYLACCASIDANLGRLTGALEAAGELDDTIVVYSSDHGSHFRTRNAEYKRSPHDASIRVPLVVRGPGFRGGQRSDALVSGLDLLPTLVSAAGAAPVPGDGHPLQEFLDGRATRTSALVQISESQVGRALRTERHTYAVTGAGLGRLARYRDSAADVYEEHLLYDNVEDPAQRHNLAGTPVTAELRRTLATQLEDEIERMEGRRPRIDVAPS
ncbi:MAG: sulfatase-like hydrolase/transferase [Candidatus Microthrix parvicella]|jgi:arylsulfatase A-like enzyme|uniref:sulfatase-like hydrolase/transferase n=1 Tax=Candidatus Neomicrothrix TaxID=41949 RepID=UPI0003633038|nr:MULTISPECIES: sulfatase-like hydrolase/transferase [Microthrix]NLH68350.1 sulfatase-like hydrolase/transferase [Candidatus Microthrix parvicella]MBK6501465.1 sulfatase-like hydrolase/transferase [Candidatus Microthrix sp.]MBK7322665.1 sulfatase-like hydrolase/transferase [Candidatus Microthrix sp.]MBP6151525.1 sulfatase-like hydrolase/transferase [Candidatus Microthrix sp.]MBP7988470.1 sulfatase-like hydrolase/transferase [Candidatus Microthrix sp.]